MASRVRLIIIIGRYTSKLSVFSGCGNDQNPPDRHPVMKAGEKLTGKNKKTALISAFQR